MPLKTNSIDLESFFTVLSGLLKKGAFKATDKSCRLLLPRVPLIIAESVTESRHSLPCGD